MVLKKRTGGSSGGKKPPSAPQPGGKKKRLPSLKKNILANPNKRGSDHLVSGRIVDDPDKPLTDQNWVMLRAYLSMEVPNVFQAYKMAGYIGENQSGVTSAWEIFNSPNFQKALAVEVEARKQFLKVDMYAVVRNLITMANANMADYATWDSGAITLKASSELTRDQAYAIVEIRETKQGVTLKLDSRLRANEMLATHLGFLIPDPSKGKDVRESAEKIKAAADELFRSVPTEPPAKSEEDSATSSPTLSSGEDGEEEEGRE